MYVNWNLPGEMCSKSMALALTGQMWSWYPALPSMDISILNKILMKK
jgi:hypothetical protein